MFALNDSTRLTVYNGTEDKDWENNDARLLPESCCRGDEKTEELQKGGVDGGCKFQTESEELKRLHCRLLLGEPFQIRGNEDDTEIAWTSISTKDVFAKAIGVFREANNLDEVLSGKTALPWDIDRLNEAISLVRIFIQLNYTGPDISSLELKKQLEELDELCQGSFQSVAQKFVEVDSIEANSNVQQPVLLLLANHYLSSMMTQSSAWPFCLIWKFRVDFLRQRTLTRRSWSLCKRLKYFAESYINWATLPNHLTSELLADVHASFLCEISEMLVFYYDGLLSERILQEAAEVLGVTVEFTGKMGYRTKYQQTPKPQTVAQVVRNSECIKQQDVSRVYPLAEKWMPRSEALNDDTRLERLRLVDEETKQDAYKDIHQLVLLGKMLHKRSFQGDSELKLQEEAALINVILDCPVSWSGRLSALVARCVFEKLDRRSVDRSLRQLEEILKFVDRRVESKDDVFRQYLFFGSGHPMKSEIKMEFGEVLLCLNHWKEALRVYSELGAFDHIVRCYEMINLRHKAEELVREKIAECGKTPKLLILLGDVTSDISYYEEAWKLSSEKSMDSQIRLGSYYFKREEFPSAIVHLKRVVELAPLEYPSWLRLAWAYHKTEDYEPGFHAYLRAANLEYDNFQVWNNLANCALKLNRKDYALRAYKVAAKCSYDEWKVWSNILVVATDLDVLTDSTQAYHRILDLNKSFVDEAVLERMVNFAVRVCKPTILVISSLAKLFGRITSMSARSTIVWLLYGRLLASYIDCEDKDCDDTLKFSNFERAMHYYDKSLMLMRQNPSWKTDLVTLQNVIKCIREFREYRERGRALISEDSNNRLKSLDGMLRQTALAVDAHISKLIGESLTQNETLQSIHHDMTEEIKHPFYA